MLYRTLRAHGHLHETDGVHQYTYTSLLYARIDKICPAIPGYDAAPRFDLDNRQLRGVNSPD
ncbi:hypothetical protein J6590_026659 [Homalodisca vitripennis]|nr:hypothetical protein J6590_026659 [Homalodisca vitripennis]